MLASGVLREQGAIYQRIIRECAGYNARFILLDAEHRLALLHMRRAIDAGYHIVIYLDGNTGAGGQDALARHGHEVPFLSSRLRVRTGAAYLASMIQCPIYPVANWRDDTYQNRFCTTTPIAVPSGRAGRNQAVGETMETLYAWLAELARRHPAQWEGWFYLQDALVLPCSAEQYREADQSSPWMTFVYNKKMYRLNRRTFQCAPLDTRSSSGSDRT